MSGTERLRTLAGAWDEWGLGGTLAEMAGEIERERACDADAIENVRLIVGGVVDDMDHHILGHEGMEDSPVARWARELREALGCDDEEDEYREAIAWVRKHGGLDAVKEEWNHSRNLKRSLETAQAKIERQQRHIEFVQRKCRERQNHIVELNNMVSEMLPRLMPEGMEWLVEAWPRFKDDAPVRLLDDFERYGEENGVSAVTMYADGSFALNFRAYSKGERVNRTAPKDLAADGKPLRERETVWSVDSGTRYTVEKITDELIPIKCRSEMGSTVSLCPSQLTHQRPDTWERIEDDALSFVEDNAGIPHDQDQMERDMLAILRRCRALAERERGE